MGNDEVVLQATGNTAAVVRLLAPFTATVVMAIVNPIPAKAIRHARMKIDKVDAAILAKLHAAGFLPVFGQRTTRCLHRLERICTSRVRSPKVLPPVEILASREPSGTSFFRS